jgi:hypothetical protein
MITWIIKALNWIKLKLRKKENLTVKNNKNINSNFIVGNNNSVNIDKKKVRR